MYAAGERARQLCAAGGGARQARRPWRRRARTRAREAPSEAETSVEEELREATRERRRVHALAVPDARSARDAKAARVWEQRVASAAARRRSRGALRWAARCALCVSLSAALVLDTDLRVDVAHGYGIWALISVVNCSERLQGELLRKSAERLLGTLVGASGALLVLSVDDLINFKAVGGAFHDTVRHWCATSDALQDACDPGGVLHALAADNYVTRGNFYLFCAAIVTIAGVYARATNRSSPNFDYFYFLSVLSFDFLTIDAYQQQLSLWVAVGFGSDTLAPQYRVYMVLLGAGLTTIAGLLAWPEYASDELRGRVSVDCAQLALLATGLPAALARPRESECAEFAAIEGNAAQIARLANLCTYEMRRFRPAGVARDDVVRGAPGGGYSDGNGDAYGDLGLCHDDDSDDDAEEGSSELLLGSALSGTSASNEGGSEWKLSPSMDWDDLVALGEKYRGLATTLAAARGLAGDGGPGVNDYSDGVYDASRARQLRRLCGATSRVCRILSVRAAGQALKGRASRAAIRAELAKVQVAADSLLLDDDGDGSGDFARIPVSAQLLAKQVPPRLREVVALFLDAEEKGLLAPRRP